MNASIYTQNESALTQAVNRWNSGDLDGYLRFYDDGIRLHGYTPQPMDKAAFFGVPATGIQIELPGITIMHFRDGQCVERWSNADMLGLLVQIGAVPPPN